MDRTKAMEEMSELLVNMSSNGATKEELYNVIDFSKAAIDTELSCDSIYEFELLKGYRDKYKTKKAES